MVQSKKFEQSFLNEYMAIKLHEYDVKERGIAIGMKKGEAQKANSIAVNMLKSGKFSFEDVALYTGLSVEYLKTLV